MTDGAQTIILEEFLADAETVAELEQKAPQGGRDAVQDTRFTFTDC